MIARHPAAPFELTASTTTPGTAVLARARAALAAGGLVGFGALWTSTPEAGLFVAAVAAAGSLWGAAIGAPVALRCDRDGVHLRLETRTAPVPWLAVRHIDVRASGDGSVVRLSTDGHGDTTVLVREHPAAIDERLRSAKVAGLVPGWVRVETSSVRDATFADRRPRSRPDLVG